VYNWNKERECGIDAEDIPRLQILLVEDSPTDALLARKRCRVCITRERARVRV
jgi:hypothetical protein